MATSMHSELCCRYQRALIMIHLPTYIYIYGFGFDIIGRQDSIDLVERLIFGLSNLLMQSNTKNRSLCDDRIFVILVSFHLISFALSGGSIVNFFIKFSLVQQKRAIYRFILFFVQEKTTTLYKAKKH